MTTRIGVISDTHSRDIPHEVVEVLNDVDAIIHCGDFCSCEDFEFFSKIKQTIGVCGNMDECQLSEKLPKDLIMKFEDVTCGVFHGRGPAKKALEFAKEQFENQHVDAVIFGHSHQPLNTVVENVLYFNPGSLTDKIYAPYRSYGILEIDGKDIKGQIIKLED